MCVDDDALVRRALRALVDAEADLRVVGEAGDGEEALRICAAVRPGVTKLIHIETPANPLWTVSDIAGVAAIARGKRTL